MSERIRALGIQSAKSDADKAMLLAAIIRFAESLGDKQLEDEARSLMPAADPFRPPSEWRECYNEGFRCRADEGRGVYLDDMSRYGTEVWQAFTDAERQDRLESPALGVQDGEKDAEVLNSA